MQMRDGRPVFSASDLTAFSECEHLTQLELRRLRGDISRPAQEDEQAELLRAKGLEHERAYLARLHAEGRAVVEIAEGPDAPAKTIEAMRSGADVIYQAAFDHDGWLGYADFLIRTEEPSDLGVFSYEPADTKLARHAKPAYVLQLCFYAEQIARVQGREPERLHIVTGDGESKTFRRADFDAYYRMLRSRFMEAVGAGDVSTYPWPVKHCEICPWRERCESQRDADDHLTLVAGATKVQVRRLNDAGIGTMVDLASRPEPLAVPRISDTTALKLHRQARLQAEQRRTGLHRYELLPFDGPSRGFAALPEPSDGDVFFDMEGYPFFEIGGAGLEYLFGVWTAEGGYRAWWAHSRAEEKRALEGLIDFLIERQQDRPDMHVYHYASYEVVAIRRLAGMHATREDEVDHLLRSNAFVDLYPVVRQSVRISQPSYSIKKVEPFYMDARETDVMGGGESVVAYERWIRTAEDEILEDIRRYNEDDCVSTRKLRDWLLDRRDEAITTFGALPQPEAESEQPARDVKPEVAESLALAARLTQGLPEDAAEDNDEQHAARLLSHLLDYHRREDRPVWWAFFDRQRRSSDELLDDADCIAGLQHDGQAPESIKSSLGYRMTFPMQETKMKRGEVVDAQSGVGTGVVVSLDVPEGWLVLKRGAKRQQLPLPAVIGPKGPIDTEVIRAALRRFAADVLDRGIEAGGHYRAARDLLLAAPPRLSGHTPGDDLMNDDDELNESLPRILRGLDQSALFIQGPPGTGKTFHAAGAICALIRDGCKVGVSSNSHEAIANVLRWVERRAKEAGLEFSGMKVGGSPFSGTFIKPGTNDDAEAQLGELDLVAGTAWMFTREAFDQQLDYLFIDEAGQISIADAVAMATAAKNVVVIGDPAQLAQVAQGTHPDGAGKSIVEHLLGEYQTLPRDRGVFLSESWRMHPDICAFISNTMYEGRLHPHADNAKQDLPGIGTGLRFLPVAHQGNRQSSEEEAVAIRERIDDLLGREWIDRNGERRLIEPRDIVVVAPYNAQVRVLRERLQDGVPVGTVDKFQGQEAAVAFFSMATSSGAELPRTLEFLFSLNRLNVAISRAQCMAYLVASPDLLRVPCRSIPQMRMVNALCRAVEVATR